MATAESHRAVEAVFRIEQARLIAGLARTVRDVGLAEELAQDALVIALNEWPKSGVPHNPGAWLMAAAKRRAIDGLRRETMLAKKHAEILKLVKPLLKNAPKRRFSEPNRWGTGDLEETALRPELVAEVRYDKVQGNRFRHGTRLIRFRDDKDPKDCRFDQLEQ